MCCFNFCCFNFSDIVGVVVIIFYMVGPMEVLSTVNEGCIESAHAIRL